MKFDLVVMAGGELDPDEWGEGAPQTKALLKLGGKSFLQITLGAFHKVPGIARRVVVGDADDLRQIVRVYGASLIPPGYGLVGNLKKVLIELEGGQASHLIIATSDIPLLTGEVALRLVEDFEKMSGRADFVYPVVPLDRCKKILPGTKRTSVRTRDGTFTGGNVFLADQRRLKESLPFLKKVIENRKSPAKLMMLLGAGMLLRLALGTGTLAGCADVFSSKISGRADFLVGDYPEIAIDVDSPAELDAIRSLRIAP